MTFSVKKTGIKVNKEKPLARQDNLQIFSLAPTTEDGKGGDVVMKIKRVLEPREREITIQNDEKRKGQKAKITDYRVIVEVVYGKLASIREKEKVKIPGVGLVEVPKVVDAVEGEIILDLQRQGNYEFIKEKLEQGIIQEDVPYDFEYSVRLVNSKYTYYFRAIYPVELQ